MQKLFYIILILFQVICHDVFSEEESFDASEQEKQQLNYFAQTQYGCILLTKYHLQNQNTQLLEALKQFTDQDKRLAYQKIEARLVQQCLQKIQVEQLSELFSQLRSQKFQYEEFSDLFMMANLDLEGDITLSDQEKILIKEINEFNKNMEEQQKKYKREQGDYDDDDDEEVDPRRRQTQSYKLFGIDLNQLSGQTQTIIISLVLLLFGGILYIGLTYVQEHTNQPKKKKDKKNKQK